MFWHLSQLLEVFSTVLAHGQGEFGLRELRIALDALLLLRLNLDWLLLHFWLGALLHFCPALTFVHLQLVAVDHLHTVRACHRNGMCLLHVLRNCRL